MRSRLSGRAQSVALIVAAAVTVGSLAASSGSDAAQPDGAGLAWSPAGHGHMAPGGGDAPAAPMRLGRAVPAPIGYLRFCARRPDQCGLDPAAADAGPGGDSGVREKQLLAEYYWPLAFGAARAPAFNGSAGASPVTLTPQTLAMIDRVNLRINRAIRYLSDQAQYGAPDYWTLPLEPGGSAAGDCKDYVLEKRRALAQAGVPASDLSIAIVRTARGESHAVLLVATDTGEMVLDSLSSRVQAWSQAPYVWLERQAPGQPMDWVEIVEVSART